MGNHGGWAGLNCEKATKALSQRCKHPRAYVPNSERGKHVPKSVWTTPLYRSRVGVLEVLKGSFAIASFICYRSTEPVLEPYTFRSIRLYISSKFGALHESDYNTPVIHSLGKTDAMTHEYSFSNACE
ncbi:hypothetical protein E1B28_002381 [Marasmius oreades]|uniref:Uncharacterized protein n=1 Tax=Marasmius oreades TaxID=181124 RepID=A0A9P7RMY3_9AGAR|nr:uncharacterized protein E1B28_002381 [Marasmius oreades]KAG7086427.1 hypothetical protein E1B28_002381 [Marasmius oreades]